MVRNSNGGGGAKKQGRKFQNKNRTEELRKSEDKNELYAIVDKIYGNGLNVYTNLGQEIWCRIPGKFKGRNKRNNYIEVGAWVLVGLYEWANENDPKSCELLYVYDRNDVEQLQNLPGINLRLLNSKINLASINNNIDDDYVDDGENVAGRIVFSENIIDETTMFAVDTGNTAIVNFDNDAIVNIDAL